MARAAGTARYPARFQLVLAANPCPCAPVTGLALHCTCTPAARMRYAARLSGPLLDRVDIRHEVLAPSRAEMDADRDHVESSADVAARVVAARERTAHRLEGMGWRTNAEVSGVALRRRFPPTLEGRRIVEREQDRGLLSPRGADRVLRLAWTLADLVGADQPGRDELRRGDHPARRCAEGGRVTADRRQRRRAAGARRADPHGRARDVRGPGGGDGRWGAAAVWSAVVGRDDGAPVEATLLHQLRKTAARWPAPSVTSRGRRARCPAGLPWRRRVAGSAGCAGDRGADRPVGARQGRPCRSHRRSVAVVGARAATSYGGHVASELGYGLAGRGWTVVSGGAFGVDALAHRGALAASGVTVAVLACGVDVVYPRPHDRLFARIARGRLADQRVAAGHRTPTPPLPRPQPGHRGDDGRARWWSRRPCAAAR